MRRRYNRIGLTVYDTGILHPEVLTLLEDMGSDDWARMFSAMNEFIVDVNDGNLDWEEGAMAWANMKNYVQAALDELRYADERDAMRTLADWMAATDKMFDYATADHHMGTVGFGRSSRRSSQRKATNLVELAEGLASEVQAVTSQVGEDVAAKITSKIDSLIEDMDIIMDQGSSQYPEDKESARGYIDGAIKLVEEIELMIVNVEDYDLDDRMDNVFDKIDTLKAELNFTDTSLYEGLLQRRRR